MKTIVAIIAVILVGWGVYALVNKEEVAPVSQENTQTPVNSEETQSPEPSTTSSIKEFTVAGKNFSFSPASIRVKKGDTVRITFQNQGGMHDLVLNGFNVRTKVLQSGSSETIEFVADKPGTFEYYCSVGTHRQMGMVGSLVVE